MGTRQDLVTRARRVTASFFTQNLALKLLALVCSVGIWAWVQTERVVERRVRVRVQYQWPEGLVQVDEVRTSLVVTVSGPQGLARTVDRKGLSVPIDLSDATEGPVSIDFTERSIVGLPAGLTVLQVSPPAIDFELDRAMTRPVQVRPAVIGDPAPGWKKVSVSVEPATTEITGPRSLVRNIAEVSTDIVDISGLRDDVEAEVRLALSERTVRPADSGTVLVKVDIEPVIGQRTFEAVPVLPRSSRWRPTTEGVEVVLEGPVAVLNELKAKQVNLVVHPPPEAREGEPLTVQFDPSQDPNPLEVVHQGPKDLIAVKSVNPSRIVLEPEE